MQLARRPASHPPDQRQGSAVTYVALCVVSAIAIKSASKAITNRMPPRCHGRNTYQCPPPAAGPALAPNGGLASQTSRMRPAKIQPSR
ncbi:hypothetical protein CVE36_20280 [Pseudomonas syringae pv. actinidiae]|nr:hypothetical protein [Pseudomonas syringae pv. actinidiae]